LAADTVSGIYDLQLIARGVKSNITPCGIHVNDTGTD
jgi:hypothetical protein